MRCRPFSDGDVSGFVCGTRGSMTHFCVACISEGVKTPTKIVCDWPLRNGSAVPPTCDKPMCDKHRRRVGDLDFCRDHGDATP